MNLASNDRERNMSLFSLSLAPRSMISDSATHDVNSVCFRSILISMPIWNNVNNFRSSVQCHDNGDVSVCTKLYSWLMIVQACLFVHLLSCTLFRRFFRLLFVANLCHGCVTVLRREIPEWSMDDLCRSVNSQLLTSRCKRIHLWRISRLFLISPMIGLVKDSSYTCKLLRLSNSRIIHLRNL